MGPHSEDRAPVLFAPDSGILAPRSYFVTFWYPLTKLQRLGQDANAFLSLSSFILWVTLHVLSYAESLYCVSPIRIKVRLYVPISLNF